MKIAQLYRNILLDAANNADNYPEIFGAEDVQIGFEVIQEVIEAIRAKSDDYLDDYTILKADYEEKFVREIFDEVYYRGQSAYIDVMLERWDDYGEI